MSYKDTAYPNLLFGVSQQAPQDRLPGQLSEQINMTSDPVAGLRRRASVELVASLGTLTDLAKVRQYNTDIGGTSVSVVVDTGDGTVRVVEEATGNILANLQHDYLLSPVASDIRMATLDDSVWVCNVDQLPTIAPHADQAAFPNPDFRGWFYISAGAYSKAFNLTITNRAVEPATTATVTYTTPNGSSASHAEQAQPEYIAEQLVAAINTNWGGFALTVVREGAYVYLSSNTTKITLSSTSGNNFIRCSNAMSIRDVAELPARLPATANNLICATGASTTKTYYRYNDARKVWEEDAAWDALEQVSNTPLRLRRVDGVWELTQPAFERRTAGDKKSNPAFKFITDGINGMTAFQGRLVLLANEYANMSASNEPLRFFRSTMSGLQDNDPIEVAAQGSLTAPYEHAVNFNKDLILFSRRYQGIIPGSAAVTPRTALAALMTRYDVDTGAEPAVAGQSVFFGAPRSLGFVGVHEMVPSSYADSQYTANDVTRHIPRYIAGPWRFLIASSTSDILIGGVASDRRELIVHEYMWNGSEKVLQSWHKWRFPWAVVDAYFSGDVLILLFGVVGRLLICRLDLQRGAGVGSATVPRLDYFTRVTCNVEGKLSVPRYLTTLGEHLHAFKVSGANPYLGQQVFETDEHLGNDPVNLTVPGAAVGDVYEVGYPYSSSFELTPPVMRDYKDIPITTGHAVIHRYRVSVADTGQFDYALSDRARPVPIGMDTTPLRLFSGQIGDGYPLAASETVTIPARLDARTVRLVLSTSDYYDLNVLNVEYGYRFHQRYKRA